MPRLFNSIEKGPGGVGGVSRNGMVRGERHYKMFVSGWSVKLKAQEVKKRETK